MRTRRELAVLAGVLCFPLVADAHWEHAHMHGGYWDEETRSPGLAAALSLTPMPVDFGNFYAESTGWGFAYTTVEVGMFVPMMVLMADGMHHDGVDDEWSRGEQTAFFGLLGGYVVVKAIAALHASHHARAYNARVRAEDRAAVAPTHDGLVAALRFW